MFTYKYDGKIEHQCHGSPRARDLDPGDRLKNEADPTKKANTCASIHSPPAPHPVGSIRYQLP